MLIVADYPFVAVGDRVFAEIPWDAAMARLYLGAFARVYLLGRRRQRAAPPAGWFPVDASAFEVLDAGDWDTLVQFLRNLPRVRRALGAVWNRVSVIHLKLFYLTSVAVWGLNRCRLGTRKPVATLLVGDAARAMLLRDDLVPSRWARGVVAAVVALLIRWIQHRAEIAGFVAASLAGRFGSPGGSALVANESWLRESDIQRHGRDRPRRPCTVLFVGRLVPLKRVNHLLDAIATLRAEGEDLRCLVVGDGPERAALERHSQVLGIGDRVRFTGWLALRGPELVGAYDAADILCLPSYSEGLPLVLVEAMARGVGVVATAVGGTPELVNQEVNGLLVPRDDLPALVVAIRRFLREPALWRRCVEAGYDTARRHTFEVQRGRLAEAIAGLIR